MQAIVMAAGKGTRLGNRTKEIPKALVKVLEKELLTYVLDFLNKDRIDKVNIVVGYKAEKIKEFIASIDYPKPIRIIENPDFDKGNIVSLMVALPHVDDDFVLTNVDHIYYNPKIAEIVIQPVEEITAICDFDRNLGDDDMKVMIKNSRIVKINKKLEEYNGGYVGMTLVPKHRLDLYKQTAFELSEEYHGNINVEQILQILANSGAPVFFRDISNLGWVEVDNQQDLLDAERKLREFGGGGAEILKNQITYENERRGGLV